MLVREDVAIVGTDGEEGALWAFDRESGAVRWRLAAGRGVASGIVEREGRVYAGTLQDELLCVDAATGETLWSFSSGPGEDARLGLATPALAGDLLIWGAGGHNLFGLDAATGAQRWQERLSAPLRTNPLVRGGDVFAGSEDGFLHRLRAADGEPLALYFVDGDPYGDIVPAGSELLLFVDWMQPRGALVAVDPDAGAIRWRAEPPDTTSWTTKRPFVIDDRVLAGTTDGRVLAFDLADGAEGLWFEIDSTVRSFAAADRVLYVGALNGSLRAYRLAAR